MTIPLRAGAIAALVLGATPVFAQPIWFTGNVEVDFQGPGVFVIPDPPGVDVGIPVQFPAGTISGHDMEDIRLSYDAAADTLYVGFNTYRIGGDVDGDGDPARTSAALAAIGGSDRPHFGGTESFTLSIDIDEDGDYDVIVGVSGLTDLSGFTVATFEGSPFAPGFAFGDDLFDHIGAVHASPSAAQPHVEFTILRFSELLGRSELDASARFGVNAFMGSFGDAGIGEDHTPGVARTVDICLTPDARDICNDFDDDCDGDIDEDVAGKGDACVVGVGACRAQGHRVCGEANDLVCDAVPGAPTAEVCDGIDNDCDGRTDEGIAPRPSQCGQGLCAAAGQITCQGGRLVDSCRPGAPVAERCNADDDDCDGRTDEGIAPTSITCGRGTCASTGVRVCTGGDLIDHCVPGEPEAEVCDGLDNDCDGRIDDEIPAMPTACGIGACAAAGNATCRDGALTDDCAPGAPRAEVCNDTDDDCDGATDEGIADRPTACGQGACAAVGVLACADGDLVDSCRPGNPGKEICNGIDDDCDGRTDEGIAPVRTTCGQGACAANGERTCQGGRLVDSCQPGAPGAEICDGIDNDCDGRVDDDIPVEPTACGQGLCAAAGQLVCQKGRPVDTCKPGEPGAEVCDGRDDDCDGRVDEGIAPVRTACGQGACAANGERTCQGGRLVDSCQPGAPGAEICDGIDNDCDGRVDDDIPIEPTACGQGLCAAQGKIICQNGAPVDTCQPRAPRAEVCDGRDDDCDGRTDEGIAPVRTQCGVGACGATGERTCRDGALVDSCQPGAPGAEQCNGRDDDCDGASDEGIAAQPTQCGVGACGATGERTCRGGELVDSCQPGAPRAEVCDGRDDDCDGRADEGIAPVRTECGIGACGATGERTCQGGRLIDSCQPGAPGAEQCNGRDDDCDGTSDEGIAPRPSNCGEAPARRRRGHLPAASSTPASRCSGRAVQRQRRRLRRPHRRRHRARPHRMRRRRLRRDRRAHLPGRRLVDTCQPGAPGAEQCNGRDDDCDGTSDEGIAPSAPTAARARALPPVRSPARAGASSTPATPATRSPSGATAPTTTAMASPTKASRRSAPNAASASAARPASAPARAASSSTPASPARPAPSSATAATTTAMAPATKASRPSAPTAARARALPPVRSPARAGASSTPATPATRSPSAATAPTTTAMASPTKASRPSAPNAASASAARPASAPARAASSSTPASPARPAPSSATAATTTATAPATKASRPSPPPAARASAPPPANAPATAAASSTPAPPARPPTRSATTKTTTATAPSTKAPPSTPPTSTPPTATPSTSSTSRSAASPGCTSATTPASSSAPTAPRTSAAPRSSSTAPTPAARSGRSTSPSPGAARAPRSADPRSRTPRSSRRPSPTSGTTMTWSKAP
ncbi:MAG: putative metal-binding motif-containing protein [Myxococcales bacterium]|nr:putative metal-binding motif-containing protein [Myxococcales bacterium]